MHTQPVTRNRFERAGLMIFALLGTALAHAQPYPSKPVRIIVAQAPGGLHASTKQGPAQRGAGFPLAGCDHEAGHRRVTTGPTRVCGVRSQRVPLPPSDALRLRDAHVRESGADARMYAVAYAPETYPSKPVRIIVAQAPGGASDLLIRVVAQKLAENLGQQFVIDNRPGAGANIGAEIAAKTVPDGYSLFMVSAPHAIAPSLYPRLSYNLMRDFTPITLIGVEQLCVVVHPSMPVKSVREFVAFLKPRPGQVAYGSTGSGAVNHLAAELFKSMAGVDMIHVPYKGSAYAIPDAINGRLQVLFANVSPLLPHIRSGRLRPLAVTSTRRSSALPNVPTLAESGYPKYEATNWYGLVAPTGTPDETIHKLNAVVIQAVNLRSVQEHYANHGVELMTSTPEEMRAFLRTETEKWANVVRISGARAE